MTINVNILLHPKEQPQLMEEQLSVEEPITSNAVEKEEPVVEEKKPTVEEKNLIHIYLLVIVVLLEWKKLFLQINKLHG